MKRPTGPGHTSRMKPANPRRVRASLERLEERMMLTAVTWTIDQAQSDVTIDIPDQPFEIDDGMGTVYSGELQVRNQSGGDNDPWSVGNSASISGTIATEYADGSSIEFLLGQSNILGVNSGSYIPDPANWNGTDFGGSLDPGPGVFGGRLYPTIDQVFGLPFTVGYFNFTDVIFDMGSVSLPISLGSFPANTTDIGISSATANIKGVEIILVGQILPDAQELAENLLNTNQAATGTIVSPDPLGQPNLRELTLPIVQDFSIEITPDTPPFMGTITGQIVATATLPDPSSVVGRHVFYNNSTFDGNDPGANAADSSAIAPDKTALLPGGGLAGPANMTSFSRGLNGVMVDIAGAHGTLTASDFSFKVSNTGSGGGGANNTPSTWSSVATPTINVLTDTPAAGTDRVEFIWPDNTIQNQYLEVRVLGNDAAGGFNTNTGLETTDVFYFGNIISDSFESTPATVFLTSAADETAIQGQIISAAPITSVYDMDRNGIHLASDRIVTRSNTITALNRINIANPPAAPAALGSPTTGARGAIASAVTIPQESSPRKPSSAASSLRSEAAHIYRSIPRTPRLLEEREGSLAAAVSQVAEEEAAGEFEVEESLLDVLTGKRG